jgi:hypothetical protein
MAADKIAALSTKYTTQLGPLLEGRGSGFFFAPSANFYVSLGSNTPDQTYVWYLDSNNEWQPVPNNQNVTVPAALQGNVKYFYFAATTGTGYNFLIGP